MNNQMLTSSSGGRLEECSFLHVEFAGNHGENLKNLQQGIIVVLLIECLRARERKINRKRKSKRENEGKKERHRETIIERSMRRCLHSDVLVIF